MKKSLLYGLLLLSGTLLGQSSYWTELKAPDGGSPIRIVQTTDGKVYAEFYDHAVFCSQNNGLHWQQIFQPSNDPDTGFAQINIGWAGTLFAQRRLGTVGSPEYYHLDVFKSTDNGATWQQIADSARIRGLAETSTGVWFALKDSTNISSGHKLLRSTDSGLSWEVVGIMPGQTNTSSEMEVDRYDRILVSEYFNHINTVYSDDMGNTWHNRYSGYDQVFLITHTGASLSVDVNTISRQGSDAEPVVQVFSNPAGSGVSSFFIFPDNTIYASTGIEYIRSTDDGLSWEVFGPNNGVFQFPMNGPLDDGTILASRNDGMARSTDSGINWSFSNFDLPRGSANSILVRGDNDWFALTESGLFRSTNAGDSWDLLKGGQGYNPYYRRDYIALKDSQLLLVMDRRLFRSDDLGQSFSDITPPDSIPAYYQGTGIHAQTGTFFVSTLPGTARSTDGGNNWETVNPGFRLYKMATHPSGVLFAIFDSAVQNGLKRFLFRSADDGQSWEKTSLPKVDNLIITPQGEVVMTDYGTGMMWRSSDMGITWIKYQHNSDLLESNASNFLFSATGEYLQMSLNGGANWQLLPEPPLPPDAVVYSYQALDVDVHGRLFASVWEYGDYGSIGHLYRTTNPTQNGAFLGGNVFKDADGDCATADPESPLGGWVVRADGADTWYALSDSAGDYSLFLDTGAYYLSVKPSLQILWESCADSLPVQVSLLQDTTEQDIPVLAVADCPYMTVQVTAPWLERCFDSYAFVHYCNEGTEAADSAWVDVTLDPHIVFVDTLMDYEALGNNTFRFQLGTLGAGDCGNLQFLVYVDCDSTLLGQTLCLSAHIYPDSLCITPPGWSGAQIQVSARCEQDTILRFEVLNTGPAPTQPLPFFVIEDDVVLMHGEEIYQSGQPQTFSLPANGHFRRFESAQEPGHPFSMKVAAWAEGCGGFESFGFTNQFFINNGIPSQDEYCGEATGAFDPNDKQGFPLGFGAERLIEPNTGIEYLVRFQNTGTAPAHTVIVRDTLDATLDAATLRMGSASHHFEWALSGQGILTLTFPDIELPDSNANEPASHGFFTFNIAQKPDLPDGTEIRNIASIYFDFNEPVRTNETLHRVGRHFIELLPTGGPDPDALHFRVFPNPVNGAAWLSFEGLPGSDSRRFFLYDEMGRTVHEAPFSGHLLVLKRADLAPGPYFFRVADESGKSLGSGKLLVR